MSTSRQLIAVSTLIELDITQYIMRMNNPNSTSPISSQNPKFDAYPFFPGRNRNTWLHHNFENSIKSCLSDPVIDTELPLAVWT